MVNAVNIGQFYELLVEKLIDKFKDSVVILSIPKKDKDTGKNISASDKTSVGFLNKLKRAIQASWWECRKLPYLLKKINFFKFVLFVVVFVFALCLLAFFYLLLRYDFQYKYVAFLTLCSASAVIKPAIFPIFLVCCALFILGFVCCLLDFYPRKSKNDMTVFFKTKDSAVSGANREASFVLVLSIREIPKSEEHEDGVQPKDDKKRIGVVLDNFTAEKTNSGGLKAAGKLLVALRDSINSASKEIGKKEGYAIIQYHVNSKYLCYRYYRLFKDNLHVYPEPENPKIYKESHKLLKLLSISSKPWSFLYTVNAEINNNHC